MAKPTPPPLHGGSSPSPEILPPVQSSPKAAAGITLIVLASVAMMLPQLLANGAVGVVGEDILTYGRWTRQFIASLHEGNLIPRWMPDDFSGYGSPAFLYYPPLAFYLAAFFSIFTDSIVVSMKLVKLSSLILTASGIFLLLRRFFSPAVSLASALFFIVLPYTVSQYYLFSSYSFIVSFCLYCYIFLSLHSFSLSGKPAYLLLAGSLYGLLLTTHIVSAYMFTCLLLAVCFCADTRHSFVARALTFCVTFCTGALLSAYYLVPLCFTEMVGGRRADGVSFSDQFIFGNRTHKLHENWSVYYDIFAANAIFLLSLSVICALILLRHRLYPARRALLTIFPLSLAGTALLFDWSLPLWLTVPGMAHVGYPARWIMPVTFCVALLSAAGFHLLQQVLPSRKAFILATSIILVLLVLKDVEYIEGSPVTAESDIFAEAGVNWLEEYLPASVATAATPLVPTTEPVTVPAGAAQTEVRAWHSQYRHLRVSALEPSTLRLRTFDFPGWTARIDGAPAPKGREPLTGALLIDVPPGSHDIVFRYAGTPAQWASLALSAASLLGLTAYFALYALRSRRSCEKRHIQGTLP